MSKKTTKKKSILGDCLYVVVNEDGQSLVSKVIRSVNARPDPYVVDSDGVCSCKAGERGIECKHSKMVDRQLKGHPVPWDTAVRLTKRYLKTVRDELKAASTQSLIDLKPKTETVDVSHVLVLGGLTEGRERLTIWTEYGFESPDGPIMLVIHAFRDQPRYERAVRAAKKKAASQRAEHAKKAKQAEPDEMDERPRRPRKRRSRT